MLLITDAELLKKTNLLYLTVFTVQINHEQINLILAWD